MSIRKRTWVTSKGEQREAWVLFYRDADGDRCQETFERKRDADAREAEIKMGMRAGMHIAPSKTPTVAAAAEAWLASIGHRLERSSLDQYCQHIKFHILPFIGSLRLADISGRVVREFEDKLRASKRSDAMIRKVRATLGSVIAAAQERGMVAKNPVRDLRRRAPRSETRERLKVGIDIPTPHEITMLVAHAQGR